MIGWIDHQRHLWSADETKLFIVTISKANRQLCDVTEAIWLAVSPNIAQNGLRTLSEPSQKVMVKLTGWIIESNASWVEDLLWRILVSHSRNSHLRLFIKVMMTNLECKIKSLLGKISDDACKVSPPKACHSFMGISSCHTVSDPTVTLLKTPLFEQFPLVL